MNENNSSSRICFFGDSAKSHELLFSNIINNQFSEPNNPMIYTLNQLTIKHCCMIGNNASTWFYGYSSIYYDGCIIILDCTIDEKDIIKTEGSVITNSDEWKTNLSFINLIHYTKDTEYCKLSYDADGIIPSNICTDCKDYIGIRDNEVDSYIQY